MKINNISISDPCFSGRLQHIPHPPKQLFSLGDTTVGERSVAIVGTRKPTSYGRDVTNKIASRLAERGVTIISGLALGVDGLAHSAAVATGGRTLAVQANGLDQIYPSSHRKLAADILATNGGILSEYEPGTPSLAHQFLERNRIVSALGDVLVVTEAATHSGTMNTVMHALQQGKEVFAVPGNITSPMSAGCNKLIEQGATPIVDIEAFIDSIAPSNEPSQQLLLAQTPEEQAIVELLQNGTTDGDELQKKSRLDTVTFSTTLTMLELRGVIHPLGANNWGL